MATATNEIMHEIVTSLMSPDNQRRRAAEAQYNKCKEQDCTSVVLALLSFMQDENGNAMLKAFAPVLLRRLIERPLGVWDKLPSDMQEYVATELLELIQLSLTSI